MKYVVMEVEGVRSRRFTVTRVEGFPEGYAYRYVNSEGLEDVVYVGLTYHPLEEPGPRMVILKRKGNNSAAVVVPTDADCPGDDLSCLVATHVMGRGYRTLYERNVPWKWIIIGLVVVVIAVAVYWFSQRGGA